MKRKVGKKSSNPKSVPKRILIVGNYGAGNLGDDAILGGIITELLSAGFRGKISVTHGGFKSSPELYKGLKKVPMLPTGIRSNLKKGDRRKALDAIRKSDLVILGGGGLFTDAETFRAPLIWWKQAKACKKLGKPYFCYGQSVGPLKSKISRAISSWVFKNAVSSLVRDPYSAKLLADLGVEDVKTGSDPAFSWLEKIKESQKENKNSVRKARSGVIAVSLRKWDKKTEKVWEPLLSGIKEFARQKKLKPIIVAMDTKNSEEIKKLRKTGMEVFEPPSARAAFEGIQRSKLVVAMRLHACIFAASAGTPCLAVSYSDKVKNLFKSLSPKIRERKNARGKSGGTAKSFVNIMEVEKFYKNPTPVSVKKRLSGLTDMKKTSMDLETPMENNIEFLREKVLS